MKKELWQDKQKVLTEDLERSQSTKEAAIRERLMDSFSSGILKENLDEFGFEATIGYTDRFTIKIGNAYDLNGERIIIADDSILFDPDKPNTLSDDGLGGFKLTPQSTGSYGIQATSGKINYVFIQYLQTVDPSVYTIKKDSTEKLYTKADDGYEIRVVLSDSIVDPITINPDPSAFLYLGYVDDLAGGVIGSGSFNTNNRTYCQISNSRFLTATPKSDGSDKTTSYQSSQTSPYVPFPIGLSEHIKAVGTGFVSPTNPHGLTHSDLGYTGKSVEIHEKFLHASGIIGDQNTTVSSLYGVVNTITAPTIDEFFIKGFLANEFIVIRDVTLDNQLILGNQILQFKSGSVPLDNGTYYVYVNNQTKQIELAGPTGKSFTLVKSGQTIVIPVADVSVLSNPNNFSLWSIDFSQAKILSDISEVQFPNPANGWSNFTNKIDLRTFGTTDSNNLNRDSLSDTVLIDHNLKINKKITAINVVAIGDIIGNNILADEGMTIAGKAVSAINVKSYAGDLSEASSATITIDANEAPNFIAVHASAKLGTSDTTASSYAYRPVQLNGSEKFILYISSMAASSGDWVHTHATCGCSQHFIAGADYSPTAVNTITMAALVKSLASGGALDMDNQHRLVVIMG
jgi:hypothetical protein